jgi:hypothetical protein
VCLYFMDSIDPALRSAIVFVVFCPFEVHIFFDDGLFARLNAFTAQSV